MDINGNAALRYGGEDDRRARNVRVAGSGTRNSTNRDERGTPSNAIKLGRFDSGSIYGALDILGSRCVTEKYISGGCVVVSSDSLFCRNSVMYEDYVLGWLSMTKQIAD